MTLLEAIQNRHSVRHYTDKPIEGEVLAALQGKIAEINAEGNLHAQLILEEPKAFLGLGAKYCSFRGVRNYIVMAGTRFNAKNSDDDDKVDDLDERVGYYGEQLVLLAQTLGLNTCWVGVTFSKVPGTYVLEEGEKIACFISIGYGETQGRSHKVKALTEVSNISDVTPSWFRRGIEAAILAPTAVNQQKFFIEYIGPGRNGAKVSARKDFSLVGFAAMDLGIVKYHFELGAGRENFEWV